MDGQCICDASDEDYRALIPEVGLRLKFVRLIATIVS